MSPAWSVIQIELNFGRTAPEVMPDIEAAVKEHTIKLTDQLGIPGRPDFKIYFDKENAERIVQVLVNGNQCNFPDELLERVYHSVYKSRGNLRTLMVLADEDHKSLVAFVSLLIVEILKINLSLLLTKENFEIYWNTFPLKDSIRNTDKTILNKLFVVFREILDLGISLSDNESISNIINNRSDINDADFHELREDLIVKSSSHEVLLLIRQEYFRNITLVATSKDDWNPIGIMRDGLFYELGLKFPKFRIVFSEEVKYGEFQFQVNGLSTLSILGLTPDECLVNDTTDRLALLNIKGTSSVNPANGVAYSIIPTTHQDIAKQAGLTTWDSLEYLILCFGHELRLRAQCFVNNNFVDDILSKLSTAWPKLVETLRHQHSLGFITQILRLLVSEGLSIRDLRRIIQAILEADFIKTEPQKYIVFDDRLATSHSTDLNKNDTVFLVEYVRSKMKEFISDKYAQRGDTLFVYLLAPSIEVILGECIEKTEALTNENHERIIRAINKELKAPATPHYYPVVLTITTIRSYFKELIKNSFPRLAVLAYNELSPRMNIESIARISFDERV